MASCFLRHGSDYLDNAEFFPSMTEAQEAYLDTARELDRYGQEHEATLHIATSIDDLAEYPDHCLRLSKHGNLIKERA